MLIARQTYPHVSSALVGGGKAAVFCIARAVNVHTAGLARPMQGPSSSNDGCSTPGRSFAAEPAAKRRRVVLEPCHAGPARSSVVTAYPPQAAAKQKQQAAPAGQPKPGSQPDAKDEDGMWMIVGLGNPGGNYDNTRHNIGFMVIDELAKDLLIDCKKLEKSAAVGKGTYKGKQVLLVKPVTFMNNSGESVAALAKFYRVPTTRVLVISDDLDQPVAQVRLRMKGGHGGHNGLRSIMAQFGGTQDFPRIKVGIGRPTGQTPVASFVLQPFSKAEAPEVAVAVKESATIVKSVLSLGMEWAVSGKRV